MQCSGALQTLGSEGGEPLLARGPEPSGGRTGLAAGRPAAETPLVALSAY